MSQQTILIVEDDRRIAALLRNVLEGEGFAVREAFGAEKALEVIAREPLALITLDISLGEDCGLDLARKIRKQSDVPIIMVTGKDDVIDRVVGLEIGADDYITKPFHVREVVARVRTVLRRYEMARSVSDLHEDPQEEDTCALCFDGMTAIPDRMELRDRDGQDCTLTSGDFALLTAFLNRPKRVLSRDQLMDLIGGISWNPLDRTIDNQVARLRKKIERTPSSPKLIKTVRGIGYTFACDVERRQMSDMPPSAEPNTA